jgi:hypothetical protein
VLAGRPEIWLCGDRNQSRRDRHLEYFTVAWKQRGSTRLHWRVDRQFRGTRGRVRKLFALRIHPAVHPWRQQ